MSEQPKPGAELAIVPETPRPAEIARVDVDGWVQVMRPILALAEKVYDTDFVPKGLRGSEAATAAAMLYGREVGLPPMTSLNMTHVVEGKPGLSAEGMRALVYAAGHEIEFVETTGAVCTMRARRRGSEKWTPLTWTIDMARAAGLTGKSNWKHYPRALLQARATTELCRMVFPDVIHGFRSVEELEDMSEGSDEAADGSTATEGTTVARKRRATKNTTAPRKPAAELPTPAGPPLPGEPGFDEPTQTTGGGEETGEEGATRDASSGEDADTDSSPPVPDAPDPDSPPATPAGPVVTGSGAQDEEPGEDVEQQAPDPGSSPTPGKLSKAQHRMLMGQFGGLGITDDREERLLATSIIVGREVESSNDLTRAEAKTLIDTLARVEPVSPSSLSSTREKLNALLDRIEESRKAEAAEAEK